MRTIRSAQLVPVPQVWLDLRWPDTSALMYSANVEVLKDINGALGRAMSWCWLHIHDYTVFGIDQIVREIGEER